MENLLAAVAAQNEQFFRSSLRRQNERIFRDLWYCHDLENVNSKFTGKSRLRIFLHQEIRQKDKLLKDNF